MNDADIGDDIPADGDTVDGPPHGRIPDMLPAPKGLTPDSAAYPAFARTACPAIDCDTQESPVQGATPAAKLVSPP